MHANAAVETTNSSSVDAQPVVRLAPSVVAETGLRGGGKRLEKPHYHLYKDTLSRPDELGGDERE